MVQSMSCPILVFRHARSDASAGRSSTQGAPQTPRSAGSRTVRPPSLRRTGSSTCCPGSQRRTRGRCMSSSSRQGPWSTFPRPCGNFDIISVWTISHACLGSATPHAPRHGGTCPAPHRMRSRVLPIILLLLFGLGADWMLIGACNPTLCPIHVFNRTAMGACYGCLLWVLADWCLQSDVVPDSPVSS